MSDSYNEIENGIIGIPLAADFVSAMDQVGKDGWEGWAIMGVDQQSQMVRVAVRRGKRAIVLATEIPSGLIKA